MTVVINGTTGVTSVNGSAAAPSVTGTDTDTGIVYGTNTVSIATGGTERAVVDSSGNLGLGVTPLNAYTGSSFRAYEMAKANLFNFDLGGTRPVAGFNTNAYLDASANPKYIGTGYATKFESDQGKFAFYTAASGTANNAITWTQVLTVEQGKSLALQSATSQTGTGITFPATQSASTDANTLDDYEEGTYTVTATPSTSGSITLSSSVNTGSYTKVGRMVSVTAGVNVSSVSSPVGKISLNLPFPPASGIQRDGWGAPSIMINNSTSAGLNTFVALLEQTSNVVGIYLGTGTSVSSTSAQQMNSSTEIFFTLTYKTST